MKIETLLNKARENAKKQTVLDYLDICDGNEKEAKELIKCEKENGEFDRFLENNIIDNIYKLIRTIRNTSLMSYEEKETAIAEIHNCPEWQKLEKKVAMTFANHFVKYKNVYLK
ncbi:hypothetical protein G4926_12555 [Anaerostipes hadrus]|uniref:hypothetical protein n=1 Tax=Anaerostipes hadrus TaxID=649756 RepID=UPI00156DA4F1|nr:hypothetical protein [Anaerostipes hadrus]NSG77320.1 hypothetical protein [Anaerostipes hadrus]